MSTVILQLLGILYSEFSPALKAAALAELQTLATKEAAHPFLLLVVQEAEKLVADLPATLPTA